jgi:hypothetical protein
MRREQILHRVDFRAMAGYRWALLGALLLSLGCDKSPDGPVSSAAPASPTRQAEGNASPTSQHTSPNGSSAHDSNTAEPAELQIEGKPLSAWLELLESPDTHRRLKGASAIYKAKIERDEDCRTAAKALAASLVDDDPYVAEVVASALVHLGDVGVRALTAALDADTDEKISPSAVRALGSCGDKGIPTLIRLIGRHRHSTALSATTTLGWMGKAAVPALKEAVSSDDANTRYWSLEALRQIGGNAADALPAIEKCLTDDDQRVRQQAFSTMYYVSGKWPKQRQ